LFELLASDLIHTLPPTATTVHVNVCSTVLATGGSSWRPVAPSSTTAHRCLGGGGG